MNDRVYNALKIISYLTEDERKELFMCDGMARMCGHIIRLKDDTLYEEQQKRDTVLSSPAYGGPYFGVNSFPSTVTYIELYNVILNDFGPNKMKVLTYIKDKFGWENLLKTSQNVKLPYKMLEEVINQDAERELNNLAKLGAKAEKIGIYSVPQERNM